ncbi:MAG TPA: MarR family transcriptional regulator [Myxococcaceae bacterium]|nr:MarR family transcriptional regulator [Myxococcaceae bacterium]
MGAIDKASEQAAPGGSEASGLGEVLEFMRLLWAIDHELQSTSKRMESRLGLTGPQRLVVRLVGQYPGISAGRLAQVMHLHPSTLTGILKRLVLRGLLTREADPLDARKARFTLTEAGHAQNLPASDTVESAVQRALSRVSQDRLQGAREVLTSLAEELGVGNAQLDKPPARLEAVSAETLSSPPGNPETPCAA